MDKLIKVLKIILLTVAIFIGIGLLAGLFFVYKGIRSGDLKSYMTKTAIEKFAPDTNLTPQQQEMLESGDYENLAKDVEENLTDEQIDCAVQVLGEERAAEIAETQDPTPQEILKLSKCL